MASTVDDWFKRPRFSRLACVLYPHLTDADTQRQMNELARGEGKRPPSGPSLLQDGDWWASMKKGGVSPLGGEAKGKVK